MNMDIIQSAAFEMLVNVALAVLALAGAYAVYYIRLGASKLKAQTAQIEDASTRKVLDDALKDVENLATLSVSAMEQTTAKALREAVKGGKASRDELVALGKQVFDEVKASIAPEAQRVITKNLGSFDEYLTKYIEATVLEIKQNEPYITVVVGALTFFMKKTLTSLEEADKRNAEDIKALDKNLNDLKADLPLIYVTREDYIRVMNRVEDKLDQILYGGKTKGKEE